MNQQTAPSMTLHTLEEIAEAAKTFERRLAEGQRGPIESSISPILFRGQRRASWELETTLERYGYKDMSVENYRWKLIEAKAAIESFLERRFAFEAKNPVDIVSPRLLDRQRLFVEGQYEFMVYLRHHGFPSPLLDWSRSMYVALFFAICDQADDDDAALYMYVEDAGYGKSGTFKGPWVSVLPETITTNKRHWIQQASYTICTEMSPGGRGWAFCSHGKQLQVCDQWVQDVCKVIRIPAASRDRILRELDQMNINEFSLYGTEDALMKTLARRQMKFSTC